MPSVLVTGEGTKGMRRAAALRQAGRGAPVDLFMVRVASRTSTFPYGSLAGLLDPATAGLDQGTGSQEVQRKVEGFRLVRKQGDRRRAGRLAMFIVKRGRG